MLPEENAIALEIFEICKNSGDINVGDYFIGINEECMINYSKAFLKKPCRCIGKVGNKSRIFVTNDKRCYFKVSGGWGEKDGVLSFIHLDNDMYFDNPTGINELRNYIDSIPAAHSWIGGMLNSSKKSKANMYLKVLEKFEQNNVMAKRGIFWIVDGELLAFPFDENDAEGVAKSGNTYNYKLLWESKKPCNKPFDYYPRGRVEITKNGEAIIFMNPNIGEEFIPKIKAAFGITTEPKIIYDHSEHYKCHLDK